MIIGLGLDVTELPRIARMYEKYGDIFLRKLLTPNEQTRVPSAPVPFLAGRFAAKEAAVKALGSGFSGGIGLQQFAEALPFASQVGYLLAERGQLTVCVEQPATGGPQGGGKLSFLQRELQGVDTSQCFARLHLPAFVGTEREQFARSTGRDDNLRRLEHARGIPVRALVFAAASQKGGHQQEY